MLTATSKKRDLIAEQYRREQVRAQQIELDRMGLHVIERVGVDAYYQIVDSLPNSDQEFYEGFKKVYQELIDGE